jgi:hypothetical protein
VLAELDVVDNVDDVDVGVFVASPPSTDPSSMQDGPVQQLLTQLGPLQECSKQLGLV